MPSTFARKLPNVQVVLAGMAVPWKTKFAFATWLFWQLKELSVLCRCRIAQVTKEHWKVGTPTLHWFTSSDVYMDVSFVPLVCSCIYMWRPYKSVKPSHQCSGMHTQRKNNFQENVWRRQSNGPHCWISFLPTALLGVSATILLFGIVYCFTCLCHDIEKFFSETLLQEI